MREREREGGGGGQSVRCDTVNIMSFYHPMRERETDRETEREKESERERGGGGESVRCDTVNIMSFYHPDHVHVYVHV